MKVNNSKLIAKVPEIYFPLLEQCKQEEEIFTNFNDSKN
jgi:hypothetical protein